MENVNRLSKVDGEQRTLLRSCVLRSCHLRTSWLRRSIWTLVTESSACAERACSLAGSSSWDNCLSFASRSRAFLDALSHSVLRVTLLSRKMLSWLIRSTSSACWAADAVLSMARSRSYVIILSPNQTGDQKRKISLQKEWCESLVMFVWDARYGPSVSRSPACSSPAADRRFPFLCASSWPQNGVPIICYRHPQWLLHLQQAVPQKHRQPDGFGWLER